MKLRIHRLAVAEIDHEVDYYESRQAGLGAELEDELEAVFAMIQEFPEAAPQWKARPNRRVVVLAAGQATAPDGATTDLSGSRRLGPCTSRRGDCCAAARHRA